MFDGGGHEMSATVGNDVPYRQLRGMGAVTLRSRLLMEDDVVVFAAAAIVAEALCVAAAASDRADRMEQQVQARKARSEAEARPTTSSGVCVCVCLCVVACAISPIIYVSRWWSGGGQPHAAGSARPQGRPSC